MYVLFRQLSRDRHGFCVIIGKRFYSATPTVPKMGIGNVQDQMLPTSLSNQNFYRHVARPLTVSIIGAPLTYGQPYIGTDLGPKKLREAGLLSNLSSLGWRVKDNNDIDFDSITKSTENEPSLHFNAKHSTIVGNSCKHLSNIVETEIKSGCFPLILGGDHSVALGSLAGILRARPNTGIIWVDAHADLNTPEMSMSGNMHGMPIGLLMEGLEKNHADIPGLDWLAKSDGKLKDPPRLNPDSIVYIGLRDVDKAERNVIHKFGIKAFTMYDIDLLGIGTVMSLAMEHLLSKNPDRPLHLSWDVDSIDPVHAPATGTAVRGGLTYREAHFIAEYVSKSGSLASAEIVELNPTLSDEEGVEETVEVGIGLITSLLGKSII